MYGRHGSARLIGPSSRLLLKSSDTSGDASPGLLGIPSDGTIWVNLGLEMQIRHGIEIPAAPVKIRKAVCNGIDMLYKLASPVVSIG